MSLDSFFNPDPDVSASASASASASQPETDKEFLKPNVKYANVRFETYLEEYLSKFRPGFNYYFTIGRFNPIHPGHIEMMCQMIEAARTEYQKTQNPFKIIIFAGSGPQTPKNQKQAILDILNNPIPFSIKQEIIKDILKIIYGENFVRDNIEIIEMGFVPKQLSEYISLTKTPDRVIRSIRVAGDKDGGTDVTKSAYVEDFLIKFAEKNKIVYEPVVMSVGAVQTGDKSASATQVRLAALINEKNNFTDRYLPQYRNLLISKIRGSLPDETIRLIINNIYDGIYDGIKLRMNLDLIPDPTIIPRIIQSYVIKKGEDVDVPAPITKTKEKAAPKEKAKAPKKAAATVVAVPALKKRGTEEGTEEGPEEEGPTKKAGIDLNKPEGGSRRRTRKTRRTKKTKRRTRKTKRRRTRRTKRRRSRRN